MIDTKTYQLTQKQYTHVVFNTLRKNVLKLIPFVLIWGLLLGWYVGYFLTLYAVLAMFLLSVAILVFLSMKNLKPFFTETHIQFDAEFIYFSKNNNTSKWYFERLKKVVAEKKYWLVYNTNTDYIYVPKNIFLTEKDQLAFKSYLKV
ncbi:YcxB family protein [uncultured Kordia sp.]|uniref:YcxB family protein n=1 Tax=uncultured Kordia sp. TaxID=507699 RepID=UPI00262DEED1|nr:YcxB family protein [uncultured Kordia sp.]